MHRALQNAGVAGKEPKPRKIRHKQFNCFKCGKPMMFIDNTNVMSCECGQYFIFSDK